MLCPETFIVARIKATSPPQRGSPAMIAELIEFARTLDQALRLGAFGRWRDFLRGGI